MVHQARISSGESALPTSIGSDEYGWNPGLEPKKSPSGHQICGRGSPSNVTIKTRAAQASAVAAVEPVASPSRAAIDLIACGPSRLNRKLLPGLEVYSAEFRGIACRRRIAMDRKPKSFQNVVELPGPPGRRCQGERLDFCPFRIRPVIHVIVNVRAVYRDLAVPARRRWGSTG